MWRSVCGVTSASAAAFADAIEHPDDADEMPLAPIGREEERRLHLRLIEEEIDGGLADDAVLRAALRVGEADRAFLLVEPRAL